MITTLKQRRFLVASLIAFSLFFASLYFYTTQPVVASESIELVEDEINFACASEEGEAVADNTLAMADCMYVGCGGIF